jgi:hypothetical protein
VRKPHHAAVAAASTASLIINSASSPVNVPILSATRLLRLGTCVATLTATLPALASPSCSTSDNKLQALECRLPGVLHLLYIAAAILTLVLIAVIVLAVRMYRRNKSSDDEP